MSYGWHAIHRSLLEHEIWISETFSRGQAWVDLLLLANHEQSEIWLDGSVFFILEGQHLSSIQKLSSRWRWSRNKVRRFLVELEKAQMIALKIDTKKTLITIVNYPKFRAEQDRKGQQKDSKRDGKKATGGQQEDNGRTQTIMINNDQECDPAAKPPEAHAEKVPVDPEGLILMKPAEAEKLIAQLGPQCFDYLVSAAADFAKTKPKKWSGYKNHAAFIRNQVKFKREGGKVFFKHPRDGPGFYPQWEVEKIQGNRGNQ